PAYIYLSSLGRTQRAGRKGSRQLIRHTSAVNRRPILAPGLGLLDLRRKLEQQVLLAEAADKLHADRQARLRPGKRQTDRRLAGNVLQRRERNVFDDRRPALHQISLLEVDRPDLHRRRCEHRRDPGVVSLLPCGDLPREALQARPAKLVLRGRDGLAELIEAPGQALEFLA